MMSHHRLQTGLIVWIVSAVCAAPCWAEVALDCRVVDTGGLPLAGIHAVVRTIPKADSSARETDSPETVQNAEPTGDDGRVHVESLPAGLSHMLEFSARGFVPAFSRRSHVDDDGDVELPDVVLRRLRTVAGTVTDADGHPLEGVSIRQAGDGPEWTSTVSGADGLFRIDGIPEGFALILAGRDGYWFTGRRAPTDATPLKIVMNRRELLNPERCDVTREPPEFQPHRAGEREHPQLAAALADDIRRLSRAGDRIVLQFFSRLCRIDVNAAAALLPELNLPADEQTPYLDQVILEQTRADFENGVARLAQHKDPADRVTTIVYHLLASLNLTAEQKQFLLARAVTELRGIDDPLSRVHNISMLLKDLQSINARETLDQLVDEAVNLLEQAGDATAVQDRFGTLAEQLAPIAPERALKLIDRASPMWSAWVAIGLSISMPEQAEEILRSYTFSGTGGSRLGRWYCLPRACYRMAHADPDRAVAVADLSDGIVDERERFSIWHPRTSQDRSVTGQVVTPLAKQALVAEAAEAADPATDPIAVLFKAKLHALIADAIAKSNPGRARELIESSVRAIERQTSGVKNESGGFIYPPSIFMASLVPTAARIDPGLAADICWRTLALRQTPPAHDNADARLIEISDLQVNSIIATLDSALASDLVQVVASRAADRSWDGETGQFWLPTTWSRIDPQRGADWFESLCDRGPNGSASPREQIRNQFTAIQFDDSGRFGSSIMDLSEVHIHSVLWVHILLDREELR